VRKLFLKNVKYLYPIFYNFYSNKGNHNSAEKTTKYVSTSKPTTFKSLVTQLATKIN
jgi:hypothetical protein